MSAVDPDHFWILSLFWEEAGKPYQNRPDHKPLLAFGAVRRYETEADAFDAKRHYEVNLSWAPQWAQNHAVSDPLRVRRHPQEAQRVRDYQAGLDRARAS